MSWVYRAWLLDLNLTNRLVRTRMPGGVGGVAELTSGSPIPILWGDSLIACVRPTLETPHGFRISLKLLKKRGKGIARDQLRSSDGVC